jgi:hypothetical protein
MMEAASTSEMVNFYQTTWCYNPEDSHLHVRHCPFSEISYACIWYKLHDVLEVAFTPVFM